MQKKNKWLLAGVMLILSVGLFFVSCNKNNPKDIDINSFLTLFKIDNISNAQDIKADDTIPSMSGINGKYIPVNGNTGSPQELQDHLPTFSTDDQPFSSTEITSSTALNTIF